MAGTSDPDETRKLNHAQIGTATWDSREELWFAEVDQAQVRYGQIGVATAADLVTAAGFIEWLKGNRESFCAAVAYQAFNYDLISDDALEESELAAKLIVQSVTVRGGSIEIWFDTGGVTTDHLLLARLNGQFKIVGMEL
jgi:hypothetical protein